jgi:hypothetical protein
MVLGEGQAKANLVVDAHLAALAIEHGCAPFDGFGFQPLSQA